MQEKEKLPGEMKRELVQRDTEIQRLKDELAQVKAAWENNEKQELKAQVKASQDGLDKVPKDGEEALVCASHSAGVEAFRAATVL
jgi:hypothetical protein